MKKKNSKPKKKTKSPIKEKRRSTTPKVTGATSKTEKYQWNLRLLYTSATDPKIEEDLVALEKATTEFARKYDRPGKSFLDSAASLKEALNDFEKLAAIADSRPFLYFHFLNDIEVQNTLAAEKLALFGERLAKCDNKLAFFKIELGRIEKERQAEYLTHQDLAHFRVFLQRVFEESKHTLSVAEEKIINLKQGPAHSNWIMANNRILSKQVILWKGKKIPLAEAISTALGSDKVSERKDLAQKINESLKSVAPFSEAEINSVLTDKKIEDELRSFAAPEDSTILNYHNDPKVVINLVQTVSDNFSLAHDFYALKAKILKLKKLNYWDRTAPIGKITKSFDFEKSIDLLKDIVSKKSPRLSGIVDDFIKNGQVDAYPRLGKKGGAYCSSSFGSPTFVLLNHIDNYDSFTTFAHEMGHAFHGELSRLQTPLYFDYSTAVAETASTFFEGLAENEILESLSHKEKIIALHNKIGGDIQTIFRQVACFNYEKEIHALVREKGYITKEELALLHNKHMKSYLGPLFQFDDEDGYFFVTWGHIRRFFYVYTYAYGQLVSKALLSRLYHDSSFWPKIEQFLSAGGKASPEEIFLKIGLDLRDPAVFEEGIKSIREDIEKLRALVEGREK